MTIKLPFVLLFYIYQAVLESLYSWAKQVVCTSEVEINREFLVAALSLLRFHPEKDTGRYYAREILRLLGEVNPDDLYSIRTVEDDDIAQG